MSSSLDARLPTRMMTSGGSPRTVSCLLLAFSQQLTANMLIGVRRQTIVKLAGLAGTIGPVLFGGVLLALSVLQYDFMRPSVGSGSDTRRGGGRVPRALPRLRTGTGSRCVRRAGSGLPRPPGRRRGRDRGRGREKPSRAWPSAYLLAHKQHLVPELEALGVRSHLLAGRRGMSDPRWPGRLRALAARFDVVHVHSPAVGAVAARRPRGPQAPAGAGLHGAQRLVVPRSADQSWQRPHAATRSAAVGRVRGGDRVDVAPLAPSHRGAGPRHPARPRPAAPRGAGRRPGPAPAGPRTTWWSPSSPTCAPTRTTRRCSRAAAEAHRR